MSKPSNRRARGASRKRLHARKATRATEDPENAWDPFETLVIYLAASRAMEKLRAKAKPGRGARQSKRA
jgi:hypothetical protein